MIKNVHKKILQIISSKDNKLDITSIRYLPRWIILIIDILLLIVSLLCTHYIFSRFITDININGMLLYFYITVFALNIVSFYVFKTYSGVIRHSGVVDIAKLVLSLMMTGSVFIIGDLISGVFKSNNFPFLLLLLTYSVLSFTLLLVFRITVKSAYNLLRKKYGLYNNRIPILIFGVDENSIGVAENIYTDTTRPFKLEGFLTEKSEYKKIRILGKKVYVYKKQFVEILQKKSIEGLLIFADNLSVETKKNIVEQCIEANVQIFTVANIKKWEKTNDTLPPLIKKIKIEDLLNRSSIEINNDSIQEGLSNKNVLITGGAGSIGSELIRIIALYHPKMIVAVDQAESQLYDLEIEIKEKFPDLNFVVALANISNAHRMKSIFKEYQFDFVYHAAAYKHVPIVENNALESIFVNVYGTMNLAKLSAQFDVKKFVLISTDKAVNPTNVMGASKRAAEIYIQSLQHKENTNTKFITTRFGNVLGSNGSVIQHFERQIAKGGPVLITHPEIIRYFMTISEACQLVLEASVMGNGGEIFVFDMGAPVKIIDLAHKMIHLSGLIPNKDIEIKIIGLRPGEKLYEELLTDSSVSLPTYHQKILIATDIPLKYQEVELVYNQLIKYALTGNDKLAVKLLKKIVKEYISNNSKYEILDYENYKI